MDTDRQRQARRTKKKIYICARKLIGLKGYQNIKVSDICSEAGVSVGLFYNYFPTKEHIFIEGAKYFDRQIKKFLTAHEGYQGKDRLLLLLDMYLDEAIEGGYRYSVNNFTGLLSYGSNYSANPVRYFHEAVLDLLKDMAEDHIIHGDVEELKELLLSFIDGLILEWCIREGNFALKEYAHTAISIMFSQYSF